MIPSPVSFSSWSGPRDARIVLVGEAFGASEAETRRPFAGESGKELFRMLGEAWPDIAPEEHSRVSALHRYGLAWTGQREGWLQAASCAMTNVFNLRPQNNKLEELCGPKSAVAGSPSGTLPPLSLGKYLLPSYLPEVDRLYRELVSCRPNLVIALGNTACWALLRTAGISSIRGTVAEGTGLMGGWRESELEKSRAEEKFRVKVLPTYHPAAMLRNWSWRPIIVADLMKGLREAAFPEIVRPSRTVLVSPTLQECLGWLQNVLQNPPALLSLDTETSLNLIDTFGLARSRSDALVIPFGPHRYRRGDGYYTVYPVRDGQPQTSYWSEDEERQVWRALRAVLESQVPKLFQNGMYDLQYILRLGIRPAALQEDTMLLHHSLFPELQKGLGFLGSIYTGEASWKLMARHRGDSEKRDE